MENRYIGILDCMSPERVIPAVDYWILPWSGLEFSACWVDKEIRNLKYRYYISCLKSITVKDVMKAIKYLLPT